MRSPYSEIRHTIASRTHLSTNDNVNFKKSDTTNRKRLNVATTNIDEDDDDDGGNDDSNNNS